jgi:hypothetical protein
MAEDGIPAPISSTVTPVSSSTVSAPTSTPQPKKVSFLARGQNDIGSIGLPKFGSDTGGVVVLLLLNMTLSIMRTWIENPSDGFSPVSNRAIVRIVAGTWIVGLGVLLVHEIDPHLALLFAIFILIGNLLYSGAGNKAVINAFTDLFTAT